MLMARTPQALTRLDAQMPHSSSWPTHTHGSLGVPGFIVQQVGQLDLSALLQHQAPRESQRDLSCTDCIGGDGLRAQAAQWGSTSATQATQDSSRLWEAAPQKRCPVHTLLESQRPGTGSGQGTRSPVYSAKAF